jgi:hypothetical protein
MAKRLDALIGYGRIILLHVSGVFREIMAKRLDALIGYGRIILLHVSGVFRESEHSIAILLDLMM